MKVVRVIYIVLGTISLGVGIVGIFVPLLPTVKFFIFTAFCYAKGSKRFHDWFVSTSLYKKHLESFIINRSMTLKTKLVILGSASIMLLFPLIFIDNIVVRIVIICLYFCKYFYFFKFIKTIPSDKMLKKTKDK